MLHDLNLAGHYADRIAVLVGRRLMTCAEPSIALAPATIHRAFNVRAFAAAHPTTNSPLVITEPLPSLKGASNAAHD